MTKSKIRRNYIMLIKFPIVKSLFFVWGRVVQNKNISTMIILLQYSNCTICFIYSDITNSPLLFNFELFIAFFVVALVERATKKFECIWS